MKAKRPPQFLCFVAGKIRHDHRDLEHLFLKQRHAQGALAALAPVVRIEISDGFSSRRAVPDRDAPCRPGSGPGE